MEAAEMTNFTFKMDKETRDGFAELCNKLGFTMSSMALALVRQAVRNQEVDLTVRDKRYENTFAPISEEAAYARLAIARQDAADGRTYDALGMGDELRKEYGI